MIRTFSMSFLAFFDFQNQKTKHPPEETKKPKKNEVKPKNNFSTWNNIFCFNRCFSFFSPSFFLVFSRGCLFLFFVLEVPKPRKLMEKVSFYHKHHFTDLFFFTCFEIKNNLFPFVFFCLFILAHLEKTKKSRHTFLMKIQLFPWVSLLKNNIPPFQIWRCRNKHWQDEKTQVLKAFDLKKNVVTGKAAYRL